MDVTEADHGPRTQLNRRYMVLGAAMGLVASMVLVITVVYVIEEANADAKVDPRSREFRGVWAATVENIDWPSDMSLTTQQQKDELIAILDRMVEVNLNALVFQIRPTGDAFYDSQLEPWSYYLTGRQGAAPSPYYDPLQFATTECHKRGIQIHAWLNPYRARHKSANYTLAVTNMARRFPQYACVYDGYIWMDPAQRPRYDVDGIHFDDYFYPYPAGGVDFPDNATFQDYQSTGGTMSKPDWRRDNVNKLVKRLYEGIHAEKPYVTFGIAPFGIWKPGNPEGIQGFSQYDSLYADPKLWLEQGWVDYLAPQLYWMIDPPQQSYPALLDWWLDQNPLQRHVYTGNYLSRIFTSSWPVSELVNQVKISRDRADRLSLGNIMFSMKPFRDNISGVVDIFKSDVYSRPAIPPVMTWLDTHSPDPPTGVKAGVGEITWNWDVSGAVRAWALYRKDQENTWGLVHVLGYNTTSVSVEAGRYLLRAVDRLGNESTDVIVEVS
ncbi:hypothetical protein Bbelb_059860 [Branchiostoma belcheri]|nr:hypothetical protein Bbelb_059860 [Branchiostoma belcheri]